MIGRRLRLFIGTVGGGAGWFDSWKGSKAPPVKFQEVEEMVAEGHGSTGLS